MFPRRTPGYVHRRLHVKRQPRLLDVSQRNATLTSAFVRLEHRDCSRSRLSLHRDDSSFDRPPCSGLSTFAHRPTNRRHSPGLRSGRSPGDDTCNTYCGRHELAAVEPGFERARGPRTIVHRHRGTVAPIDANLDQRPVPRPPCRSSTRSKPTASSSATTTSSSASFTSQSRKSSRTKKCGEPPPHFTRGPGAAQHEQCNGENQTREGAIHRRLPASTPQSSRPPA